MLGMKSVLIFLLIKLCICAAWSSNLSPSFNDDGCGITMGCYRVPDKCSESDCTYLLTWIVNDDNIVFSFTSRLSSGMGWSGFSVNDRRRMAGGSVVDCIVLPNEHQMINIQMSYNEGKDNDPLDNRFLGLKNGTLSGQVVDSVLQCNFTRLKLTDPSDKEHFKVKDLNQPYYVIMGQGPVRSDGTKKRHKHKPHMSSNEVKFTEHANYGAARSAYIIAHASLMIVAWMLFASIGIATSRYLKPDWNEKELCYKVVWFQIHRICMIATVCFCLIAIILIFDASNWQFLPPKIHPLLGFISFILLLLNPIVAALRPTPEHRLRWIFKLVHGSIGHISHIIAVFTIFYGTRECYAYMPFWAEWVVAGFCGWRLLADLLLTILSSAEQQHSRNFSAVNQSTEQLLNAEILYSSDHRRMVSVSRRVIIIIYVIGCIGATVALLYAINSPVGIVDCC